MLGTTNVKVKPNKRVIIDYVEYIESSGTQYIDTGVVMDENKTIEVDFQITKQSSTDNVVLGAFDGSRGCVFGIKENGDFQFAYGGGWNGTSRTDDFNRHFIIANSLEDECLLDGVVMANANDITTSLNSNTNITLMYYSFDKGVYKYYGYLKIYSCKIYDGGILVRDFKPCKDGAGVYCLYDEVEKRYYYNQGSGSFTGGASV